MRVRVSSQHSSSGRFRLDAIDCVGCSRGPVIRHDVCFHLWRTHDTTQVPQLDWPIELIDAPVFYARPRLRGIPSASLLSNQGPAGLPPIYEQLRKFDRRCRLPPRVPRLTSVRFNSRVQVSNLPESHHMALQVMTHRSRSVLRIGIDGLVEPERDGHWRKIPAEGSHGRHSRSVPGIYADQLLGHQQYQVNAWVR